MQYGVTNGYLHVTYCIHKLGIFCHSCLDICFYAWVNGMEIHSCHWLKMTTVHVLGLMFLSRQLVDICVSVMISGIGNVWCRSNCAYKTQISLQSLPHFSNVKNKRAICLINVNYEQIFIECFKCNEANNIRKCTIINACYSKSILFVSICP